MEATHVVDEERILEILARPEFEYGLGVGEIARELYPPKSDNDYRWLYNGDYVSRRLLHLHTTGKVCRANELYLSTRP